MPVLLPSRLPLPRPLPLPPPAVSAVDHFSGQICGRRQRLRCRPRRLLHRTAYWQRMGQNRLGTCSFCGVPVVTLFSKSFGCGIGDRTQDERRRRVRSPTTGERRGRRKQKTAKCFGKAFNAPNNAAVLSHSSAHPIPSTAAPSRPLKHQHTACARVSLASH